MKSDIASEFGTSRLPPDKREVGSSTLPRPIFGRTATKNREERGRKEKGDEELGRSRWPVCHGAALLGLLSPFPFLFYDPGLTRGRKVSACPSRPRSFSRTRRASTFSEAVCAATRRFPRGHFFLADQLNRAAASIAANLAEGNGRFTVADRRNFFGISRGSVRECVPLLEIAVRQQVLTADGHQRLRGELEEISRMVAGLINGLDRRQLG